MGEQGVRLLRHTAPAPAPSPHRLHVYAKSQIHSSFESHCFVSVHTAFISISSQLASRTRRQFLWHTEACVKHHSSRNVWMSQYFNSCPQAGRATEAAQAQQPGDQGRTWAPLQVCDITQLT